MKLPVVALLILFALPAAAQDSTQYNLFLHLLTDCWPEETSWKITDADQNEVASGGPYTGLSQEEINEAIWLTTGSYIFTIYDAAGDGMHGTQWGSQCDEDGNFTLIDAGDNILLDYDGSYNFDSLTVAFEFDETVDVDDLSSDLDCVPYPNPFIETINLKLKLLQREQLRIEIFSLEGKMIYIEDLGFFPAGQNTAVLDLSHLPGGIYSLKLFSVDYFTSTLLLKIE